MKMRIAWMALLAVALLLTGCVEERVTLKLNKDGSGRLIEETYLSPRLSGMVKGATGAAASPLKAQAEAIDKRVAAAAPYATLVAKEAKTNDQGWKGFALTFAFDDASKLDLGISLSPKGNGEGEGDSAGAKEKTPLKIRFTKGPKPTVFFWVPSKTDSADTVAPAPVRKASPAKDKNKEAPMPDAMMEMMKSMLQGMRISYRVEVDGKITQTTSRNKLDDQSVMLLDFSIDRLFEVMDTCEVLNQKGEDAEMLKKLGDMNVPGLMADDFEKGVLIEFE